MNKIYKVVWSKAAEAYVVTSELAKSCTKSPSGKGLRRSVTAALLAAIAVAPVSFGVYAADDTHYVSVNSDNQTADSNYDNQGAQAKNSIAIGPSVKTTGEDNIIIGSGEIVSEDKKDGTSFDGTRVLVVGHGNYFQPTSEWDDNTKGKSISYRDVAIIGHSNKLLQGNKADAGKGHPTHQLVHGWENTLNGSYTGAIGYENEIKNNSRPGFTSHHMAFAIGSANTIDATGYYMGDKNRINTLPDYTEPSHPDETFGADLYVIGRHNIVGSNKDKDSYVNKGRIIGSENVVYCNDVNVFGKSNKAYGSSALVVGTVNRVGVDEEGNLITTDEGGELTSPVAVGVDNVVTAPYGVAVGAEARAEGYRATAVGSLAVAPNERSTAMGSENRATGYSSVAVGTYNNSYDFDTETRKSYDSGMYSSAIGVMNISTAEASSAIGAKNTASGKQSSSFGYRNTAAGMNSSAVGYYNKAQGDKTSALGYFNQVTGKQSSAVGMTNYLTAADSTAIGNYNNSYNMVTGDWERQTAGTESAAIGIKNHSAGNYSSALGSQNKSGGTASSAVGYRNITDADLAAALGYANQATAQYSSAVGARNVASGYQSSAVGNQNQAEGENSSSLGYLNIATGKQSSALGFRNYATAVNSAAIGIYNNKYNVVEKKWEDQTAGDYSVAIGAKNHSAGGYSSALGYENMSGGTASSAVGYRNITDADQAAALGYANQATAQYSFATGVLNQASGQYSSSVGAWNQAEGTKSQALGFRNFVSGYGAVALGSENNLNFVKQYQALGFVQTGELSSALGISNTTAGRVSMGVGNSNYAFGTKSVGVGLNNYSTGYETLAMGHYAVAGSEDLNKIDQVKYAAAIGNRAKSTITDAVAIGSFSNTTRDKGDYGYNPVLGKAVTDTDITDDANIGTYRTELENARAAWQTSMEKAEELLHKIHTQQYADDAEYQQWSAEYDRLNADADAKMAAYDAAQKKVSDLVGAWQGQMAALSVGDEATGRTRQITGVAAGSADTDAVNVAQLKVLGGKVTANADDIATLKEGWTLQDAKTGKKVVKAKDTVKVTGDEYITATVDNDGLTLGMDETKLNSQINNQIDNSKTVQAKMTSWVLKAATTDKDPAAKGQTIDNTNNVATFGVEKEDQGLTVARDGATIKYGIDGSKIDLAGNTSITNLNNKIEKSKIHYFSVKSDDSANPDGTNWKNDGATGENAIAIGKDAKAERESSVVIGLKASSGDAANDGVAVGSSASVTGFGGVAIGRESSAEGQETVAIGTGAKGVLNRTIAIGGYANADGFGAVAIGRDSSSKERGVALGNSSFSHAYSVGVGEKAIAEAPYSVAVGDLTGSYAMGAVTLGNKTRAFGDSSVAIGNQARVSGKPLTEAEYNALPEADQKLYRLYEAVYYNYDDPSKPIVDRKYFKVIDAQDWRAEKHYNSIAIGTTSFVEAKEAIGIGAATRIHGDRGVALGYAAVSEENGTALGAGAQAKANAGVALGEGAVADTAAEVAGYDPKTGKASTETTPTWKSVKGAVSVGNANATRQITNLAAGLADTDAVNVAQLKALNTKVDQGAIHYYSVTSDKKAAGSNYDNDGAKADDSMVIGIGSTSEVINSTVIGNNNTLKNTLKVGQRDRDGVMRNNSIVAGENIEVDGTRNAVFATDYKEGEHKLTKVAGKHNTVIGVGNLVGYTAKADPNNRNEFIYEKTDVASSHANVVVGMTNTVKGSSVVVGMNSEIKAGAQLATSVGHANTIQGSDEYGLALGNKLLVEGYGAIAVGTESKATADDATAIGTEAVAEQAGSIAFGHAAEAKNEYSIAFGLFAKAKARSGVAIGSSSLADREKGSIGYLAGENTSEVWKATKGAISVGNKEKKYTRQITGVAAGSEDTDAVNVAQLKAVESKITQTGEEAQKHTSVAAGTNISVVQDGLNAEGGKNYKVSLAKDIDLGADGSIKAGNTTINNDGLTIKGGPSVTTGGINAGDKKITNVAAGSADTDAVNVSQLKKVQEIAAAKTTIEAGDNIKVEKGSVKGSYKISATDTTLQKGDKALSLDGTNLNLSVKDTAGNEVTGSVDLKDLKSAVNTDTTYTLKGEENDNNTTTISLTDSNGKKQQVTVATKDTRNTIADSDTVTVEAKAQEDGSNEYTLNVKTDGKVAKGDKGIVTGGTVYNETRIEKDGNYIKAENTASQNLTVLDKQVNVNATNIANLSNSVHDMGNRVDRVGAGAAALAALHPLDFDPDDKWDFAAGYGNYSGANAVAIGAYYRPNEDTMFSVGGSFGGGENMVNAGVSVKLGQGNHVSTSRVAMAKDMLDMQQRMAEMEAQMAKLQGFIGALTGADAQAAMFPDVPENHWAYEYVDGLREQGIIEGYPDGNFAGDRSMTRYEIAAMLYRALSKGVSLDARAVKEFAPELARIRVDVVTKDKEGQPVIERVRVNEEQQAK